MKKKLLLNIALVFVLGFAVFFLIRNWQIFTRNPAAAEINLEYVSFGTSDSKGNYYVIDKSRRRVVSCDRDGVVRAVIDGGRREQRSFFYANEVTADEGGRIYILNWVLDKSGFFMEREEILRYTPEGSFEKIIYSKTYDEKSRIPTLVQRGQLCGLFLREDTINWYDVDMKGIWSYSMNVSGGALNKKLAVELADANLIISSVVPSTAETVLYATKKGEVIEKEKGHPPVLKYSADIESGSLSIPWHVGADKSSAIYFSDLEKRKIMKITDRGKISTVLSREIIESQNYKSDDVIYYRFSILPDGRLITCNDSCLVALDGRGKVLIHSGSFRIPGCMIFEAFILWFMLLSGVISFMVLGWSFFTDIMNRKVPDVLLKATGIIIVIGVSAVLVSSLIVQNFSARYQKEALNKIAQMVQIIPKVADASSLEKITRHKDFLGKDYCLIRDNLLSSLNYNKDEWNNSYYFVIYKVINEKLYAFMYLNGEVGIYYPLSWFDEPEGIYRRAYKGEIATESVSDAWGSWLYGVGPIYNRNGRVVALIEVGTDLYSFTQENNRLIHQIILDVVTMLVIFVLAMIEATFLLEMLKQREKRIRLIAEGKTLRKADHYTDAFLARPVTFIFFTAISMSVVFIPLMMQGFYHPIAGLSKNLVLGLPISCEMLFFGISSIYSGSLIAKRGWRFVARLGFLITGIGLLSSGMSSGMFTFLAARGITGLGAGFFFMSMRGLINCEGMLEMRGESFSNFYSAMIVGTSIGAVVGGIVADKFGYPAVFYFAFVILITSVIFDFLYFREMSFMETAVHKKPEKGALISSLKRFFSDPHVIGFFLLIVIPTYVASTFLTYFFPIFAESNSVSSSTVGRLFILNGVFIIYLGPVLSRFFSGKMNPGSTMVFGSALWAGALLISAITGNFAGAVIALILMGITEGFCVSAQNNYFLEMKASQAIGEDQAIGYFEMVGKFAEMFGPILFSLAIILGQLAGLSILAAGVFGFAAFYVFYSIRKS